MRNFSKKLTTVCLAVLIAIPVMIGFASTAYADDVPEPGEPILSMDGSVVRWVQTPAPADKQIISFEIRVDGVTKATVDSHVKYFDLDELNLPKGTHIIIVAAKIANLGTDGVIGIQSYVLSKQSIYDTARDPDYVVPPIGELPGTTPPIGEIPGGVTPPVGNVPGPGAVTPPIGTPGAQLPNLPMGPLVLNEGMTNMTSSIEHYVIKQPFFWERNIKDNDYNVGYVSLRIFAENFLGVTPGWDAATGYVTIQGMNKDTGAITTLKIQSNNTTAYVDGRSGDIASVFLKYASGPAGSISAINRYDNVYLPFRFVAEAFGFSVAMDGNNVIIND